MIDLLFLLPAANLAVSALTGMKAEMAEVALGPPDIDRREAHGAMWTYRKDSCVLFVFLADKGDGLKVTSLSAGPRRTGEAAPTAEACLKQPSLSPPSGASGASRNVDGGAPGQTPPPAATPSVTGSP